MSSGHSRLWLPAFHVSLCKTAAHPSLPLATALGCEPASISQAEARCLRGHGLPPCLTVLTERGSCQCKELATVRPGWTTCLKHRGPLGVHTRLACGDAQRCNCTSSSVPPLYNQGSSPGTLCQGCSLFSAQVLNRDVIPTSELTCPYSELTEGKFSLTLRG